MSREKILAIGLVLFFLPLFVTQNSGQTSDIILESFAIRGEIKDNYANLTYNLVFDNTESIEDRLLEYSFIVPKGTYLSNVSAQMGNFQYWGQVKEIQQAQQEFNQSISANKSAILVTAIGNTYKAQINVIGEAKLYLIFFVEGFLTRELGIYDLIILNIDEQFMVDFEIDIDVTNTFSAVIKARLEGISPYERNSIPNGKNIYFNGSDVVIQQNIEFSYTLNELPFGGAVITHNNGTDNFFAYLFAPQIGVEDEPETREYIFTIDVSGSMNGQRLLNAKLSFITMMETLSPTDLFNVVVFSSSAISLWPESVTASTNSIDTAVDYVDGLSASGSTNIDQALEFSLNSFVGVDTVKVIAFLSDGEPTEGEDNTNQILQNVLDENNVQASIFTIALGDSSAEGLMASLAYRTHGEFIVILDSDPVISKMTAFYDRFAIPIALGVSVTYTNAKNIYPSPSSLAGAVFNGSEIIQSGMFSSSLTITTNIRFSTGNQEYVTTVDTVSNNNPHVEMLWAFNTISHLLKIIEFDGETEELTNFLVSIAIDYGIIVPNYTALIIVLEEVDAETTETTENNDVADKDDQTTFDQTTYIQGVTDTQIDYDEVTSDQAFSEPAMSDPEVDGSGHTETEAASDENDSPGFILTVSIFSLLIVTQKAKKVKNDY